MHFFLLVKTFFKNIDLFQNEIKLLLVATFNIAVGFMPVFAHNNEFSPQVVGFINSLSLLLKLGGFILGFVVTTFIYRKLKIEIKIKELERKRLLDEIKYNTPNEEIVNQTNTKPPKPNQNEPTG